MKIYEPVSPAGMVRQLVDEGHLPPSGCAGCGGISEHELVLFVVCKTTFCVAMRLFGWVIRFFVWAGRTEVANVISVLVPPLVFVFDPDGFVTHGGYDITVKTPVRLCRTCRRGIPSAAWPQSVLSALRILACFGYILALAPGQGWTGIGVVVAATLGAIAFTVQGYRRQREHRRLVGLIPEYKTLLDFFEFVYVDDIRP